MFMWDHIGMAFTGCSFIHVLCAIFHSVFAHHCTLIQQSRVSLSLTANKQHLKPLLPTKMRNYFMGFNRFYYTSITPTTYHISRLGNSRFGLHNNLSCLRSTASLSLSSTHSLDLALSIPIFENLICRNQQNVKDTELRKAYIHPSSVIRWDQILRRTRQHMDDIFIPIFQSSFFFHFVSQKKIISKRKHKNSDCINHIKLELDRIGWFFFTFFIP